MRFASAEREPTVNVITPTTVDLEPIINCLQDTKGRMDKIERREQPARASTPSSRSTSPAQSQSQSNQRGGSSPRLLNDNNSYRRVQSDDQQLERFNDVPNYPVSTQQRRFQAPSSGWNDVVNQQPTPAWGGDGPRFQGMPPWWTNPGPRYSSPQSTPTPLMGRGSWFGRHGRGFTGRGQWFNNNRGRGYQGNGRGFGNRSEDEGQNERHEDPTPRPGPAESRPGRGRGRSRGCYVCETFGCHSRNHVEEQGAEFRRYEQLRSSSVPLGNRSQGNGPRSPPAGNRAPSPTLRPQSQ